MAFMYNFEIEESTKRRKEQLNPLKYKLSKLIQNIDILEKFNSALAFCLCYFSNHLWYNKRKTKKRKIGIELSYYGYLDEL